ncbi:ArsR/SmtB family transcription factor [Kribbella kalugense]|uniref:Helix-turn-helix protein n=1 Tax=Kribbella kalugense TaxID=2512221 RepID=A0A4V6Q8D6_9ACTN|nr:winged helix-turn-helix domain-containing protein [Kribbella kalugense]TDW18694.1 helix-turn-helix protein [Kribbella kalugense]
MIRVHFTAADLGRVTFRTEPQPLWEAVLAARALGARSMSPVARRWRRTAAPRVQGSMRPLFKLISPTGMFPDFLLPETSGDGLDPAIEALMDTPAEVIRAELEPWLPPGIDRYMQGLLDGRAGSRRALGVAVRDFHQQVLIPSSAELNSRYGADLGIRTHALLHGGLDTLLSALHPDITWATPTLTTHGPLDLPQVDIQLGGRGLELYPSPLTSSCLFLDVPDRRPVLVYPSAELPTADPAATTDSETADALADLLGRTRAAVLRALTHPATTTQLARRVGISLASTSDHTRVLRAAGLITTHRTQGTALHSLTPTAHPFLTRASGGIPGQIANSRRTTKESGYS